MGYSKMDAAAENMDQVISKAGDGKPDLTEDTASFKKGLDMLPPVVAALKALHP